MSESAFAGGEEHRENLSFPLWSDEPFVMHLVESTAAQSQHLGLNHTEPRASLFDLSYTEKNGLLPSEIERLFT